MQMALSVILAFLLSGQVAVATEIDDTSSYYTSIADSGPLLDAYVQVLIDKAKSEYSGCNSNIFGKRLAAHLTGNLFYGSVEDFANKNPEVAKISSAPSSSIYRGTPFEFSLVAKFVGMGPVVNVDGVHVGTDKLGHFFDMGYSLFQRTNEGIDLDGLLAIANREEDGLWGGWTTGVKSYGDISSNLDGYRFWQEMLRESKNPYFVCEGKSLRQIRNFHFSDYVTYAWNEATNCNGFSNSDYWPAIQANIETLEKEQGKRFACPIEVNRCAEIRRHYSQWFSESQINQLISFECR